jgi:hypothetical protein
MVNDQPMADATTGLLEPTLPHPPLSVQTSRNLYFNKEEIGNHPPLSGASTLDLHKAQSDPQGNHSGIVMKSFQINTIRLGAQEQELLTIGVVLYAPGCNPQVDLLMSGPAPP